jgi:hypothetical protein
MHGHGEVGVTTERRDAVHECMRRERGRNAQACESVEHWPEVREGLTYDICMSMKRKQHYWVHKADKLGHERAYARGSRADAASHGTYTGAEQVLRHKSCLGQIRRGGMTGGVHPSSIRKRDRVSWASRLDNRPTT